MKTLSGDLDGAAESADRAVARMPNFDEAWFIRSWIRMLLGNADDAVRSLEHTRRLCPIVNAMGDLEWARREVARTLKLDPTYTVERFISPNLYRDKTVMDRCA